LNFTGLEIGFGLWETMSMKIPALVTSNTLGTEPTLWKCPACSQKFDLSPFEGNQGKKQNQMLAAYDKHFKAAHAKEDASQAAARIVRQATEG
jgi:hypothetical protein